MKLLESMSEKIDSCLTFIISLCVYLVDFCFSSNQDEQIESNFPNLKVLLGSKFLQLTNPELRVDAAVTVLTSLSYYVIVRDDLTYLKKLNLET